jgi:ribonucleotide monophosphatase NagD (HAD superfamily)
MYAACLFDLDGTLYLGDELLPGAQETVHALRELGIRTIFLSNNPTRTSQHYPENLTQRGIPTAD